MNQDPNASDLKTPQACAQPQPTMLVLGATSEIAVATLHLLAQEGWSFILTGRNLNALDTLGHKLTEQYACHCTTTHFDTHIPPQQQQDWWQEITLHTPIQAVLCAIGYLGQPHVAEQDLEEGMKILMSNFGGLIPVLSLAANYFEQRQHGKIIVISSVAGERGRASNYAYGSAKAGMNAYLSGLRARLSSSQVQVLTVLPGLVKTRMIADRPPKRPCALPEEVARDIVYGIHHNKDVIYSRWYWRYIMWVVKHLPEVIFKRIRNI